MPLHEGQHRFLGTFNGARYFDIAMNDHVGFRVQPGGEYVAYYDTAVKDRQPLGHAHVTFDDAAYDCGPGGERSLTPGGRADNDFSGRSKRSAKLSVDPDETVCYEVSPERAVRTEESVYKQVFWSGHLLDTTRVRLARQRYGDRVSIEALERFLMYWSGSMVSVPRWIS